MHKKTLIAMTLALAGVFLAAGPAGAAIAEWNSQANVGNRVHFTWDDVANEWNAQSTAGMGQDTTWERLPEAAYGYNSPQLGGTNNFGNEAYWQPVQGEFIYTPSIEGQTNNVFDFDPWYGMTGGLSNLAPPTNQDIRFAGIWEFELFNGPDHMDDLEDIRSTYGGLPANLSTSWRLDLSNRPTSETDRGGGVDTVVARWEFDLNQQFDRLDDWETEPVPAVQWYEDAVYEDTWSGFHLLRDNDGDLTNRGYMLLATNNRALWPWTGDAEDSVGYAVHWREWDKFTQEDLGDYYHVGVTGVRGNAHLEVVPEPATMTLLGLGLAGFVTRRFMSRKKA